MRRQATKIENRRNKLKQQELSNRCVTTLRITVYAFIKPRLHDTTGCETGYTTGLTTGLTTGCIV